MELCISYFNLIILNLKYSGQPEYLLSFVDSLKLDVSLMNNLHTLFIVGKATISIAIILCYYMYIIAFSYIKQNIISKSSDIWDYSYVLVILIRSMVDQIHRH